MLRLTNVIEKKKTGEVLSHDEISYFVRTVTSGSKNTSVPREIADPCQIGAMMMAIFLNGITDEETNSLMEAMKMSGYIFEWPSKWKHLVVDKHSTGGVGDKVSLILAPALAACGMKVPMISGRSLAHTGGTLDKLESIPGFKIDLTPQQVQKQVSDIGCCIVGQTEDIVPADKVIYRCRDLTSTVNCLGLIVASIVSKKLAEGCSALVYDVKFGGGTQFKSQEKAEELARKLVRVSSSLGGTKSSAILTSMDVPSGTHIGNGLEVLESVQCLRNQTTTDVMELVYDLGSELLVSTNVAKNREDGITKLQNAIQNSEALKKFHEMMIYQGVSEMNAQEICYGDPKKVLTIAKHIFEIAYIGNDGYVDHIDARTLGELWKDMVSLYPKFADETGFILRKKVGDWIKSGDIWLELHQGQPDISEHISNRLQKAIHISSQKCDSVKRIYKVIRSEDLVSS